MNKQDPNQQWWTEDRRSEHLAHWACFECRKMFRKPISKTARVCPQCRKPMIEVGPYFEPPRSIDKRLWNALKELADVGVRFQRATTRYIYFRKCGDLRRPSSRTTIARIRAAFGEKLR